MIPSAWRQTWRALRVRPAFLLSAVLTLGFGAGITTAVFSLVDTVLLKPLPYPDPDRLLAIQESSPAARQKTSLAAPVRIDEWHRLSRSFVAISGSYAENVTDTSGTEPERLEGRRVAPRFFTVFAMPPLAGRFFTDAEEQANGPGAAMISEDLWTRRYQRDPRAIGRALTIGSRTYTIVGIMPRTFTSAKTDVWLPAQLSPQMMRLREARFMTGVGRLKTGVDEVAGARELEAVQAGLAREFPNTDKGWSVDVRPLKDAQVGDARRGLALVFAAVASLWLIAVANIAGLSLVQAQRRTRELAVRAALGASRARVMATVFREGLLVSLLGGALGLLLARWLIALMPALLRRTPRLHELGLDWRALTFVLSTSLLASLFLGLIPAIAGTRPRLSRLIASGSRSVSGGSHYLQRALVIGQVALSLLLVASATMLLRGYYTLTHAETGFDATNAVTFHVAARWDEERVRVGQMQERLLASVMELPHVQAAGMTNFLPAAGATLRYQVRVDGLTGPNSDGSIPVGMRMISGGYLRAIQATRLAGDWCLSPPGGNFKAPLSVMVNQRFIDLHASAQNLIGRSLRIVQSGPAAAMPIVGVIGNLAEDGHATTASPYVYVCGVPGSWPDPDYIVRTTDARALATDLRRIVRELDPTRAIFGLRPLQEVLDAALDRPRFDTGLLLLFAAAAVTLASIGLYSLFMLLVFERTREMAVRMAMGAQPREVMQLVLGGAGRLLALGILVGMGLTMGVERVLRGTLFGADGVDARTLAAAALILIAVSAIAVLGPARRASRIAPIVALRAD